MLNAILPQDVEAYVTRLLDSLPMDAPAYLNMTWKIRRTSSGLALSKIKINQQIYEEASNF